MAATADGLQRMGCMRGSSGSGSRSLTTRRERDASIHYLMYEAAEDKYDAAKIHEAIERYWKPSMVGWLADVRHARGLS